MRLQDQPDVLRTWLQTALDEMDGRDDIVAIWLACGLCGRGTVSLNARRHPLALPRAHDRVTVLMGSKEAHAAHQRACPSCYYCSPGPSRDRCVSGQEKLAALRMELEARFDADNVEFLLETERDLWARHDAVTVVELGTNDAETEADYARYCAEWLVWKFERVRDDPTMLRDMLQGNRDSARFQLVPPGHRVGHSTDDDILRAELASP